MSFKPGAALIESVAQDRQGNQIVFQRGYWDRLTFLRINGLPVPSA